jgi:hypothetical protein
MVGPGEFGECWDDYDVYFPAGEGRTELNFPII